MLLRKSLIATASQSGIRNLVSTKNFIVSQEIQWAISKKKPVVALESTIITHGFPYPDNLKLAREIEAQVRNEKCVPATIAIFNGKITVGLNDHELEELASGKNGPVKVSRRDLPYVMSQGLHGGTTVSGTMIVAHMAGIPIFATGGIGGVHKGGENSMDVSADLTELGRTPVTVVSAGIKSILDIGRSLEYLETLGVTVAVLGDTPEFPAFFSPRSGFRAAAHLTDVRQAARLIESRDSLKLASGLLVAVPIPSSGQDEGSLVEEAVREALERGREEGIQGKDITPYVLSKVNQLTKGASLKLNRTLVLNNARVASQIAVELSQITTSATKNGSSATGNGKSSRETETTVERRPVVIGASNVDIIAALDEDVQWRRKTEENTNGKEKTDGRTYGGKVSVSLGGVGRNIADCLTRLGDRPYFISSIGNDVYGQLVLSGNPDMDKAGIEITDSSSTGKVSLIQNAKRECEILVGDFDIHQRINVANISQHEDVLKRASLVAIDANIPIESMDYVLGLSSQYQIPVWYEPTDINKADLVFRAQNWTAVTIASPNLHELKVMSKALGNNPRNVEGMEATNDLNMDTLKNYCLELSTPMLEHWRLLVVTLGSLGVITVTRHGQDILGKTKRQIEEDKIEVAYHPPLTLHPNVISVTGAGDCLAAGIMSSLLRGCKLKDCIRTGLHLAELSLNSPECVPKIINQDIFPRKHSS